MRRSFAAITAVGLLVQVASLSADDKPAKPPATPEAVFKQFVKLSADGKIDAMLEYLTKEHGELLKEELALASKFTTDEAKAIEALNAALDKSFPVAEGEKKMDAKPTGWDVRHRLRSYARYDQVSGQEKKTEDEVHLKITVIDQKTGKPRSIAVIPMVREGSEWRIRLPINDVAKRESLQSIRSANEAYLKKLEELRQGVGDNDHFSRTIVLAKHLRMYLPLTDPRRDAYTRDFDEWLKYQTLVEPEKNK